MIDRLFPAVPRPAVWLALAGLIPFYAGAVGAWVLPDPYDRVALQMLVHYAVLILSFLGGVHWGLAVGGFGAPYPGLRLAAGEPDPDTPAPPTMSWGRLGWSVAPSLAGWAVYLLQGQAAIVYLMLCFVAMLFGDFRAAQAGTSPYWYLALRRPVTFLVIGALLIALVPLSTNLRF